MRSQWIRPPRSCSCSPTAGGIKRDSAYRCEFAVVEYRWHPLHGKRLLVIRRTGRRGSEVLHVETRRGIAKELPAWMFDRATCSTMSLGPPQDSIEALLELREILDLASPRLPKDASSTLLEGEESSGEAHSKRDGQTARVVSRGKEKAAASGGDTRSIQALADLLLEAYGEETSDESKASGGRDESEDHI